MSPTMKEFKAKVDAANRFLLEADELECHLFDDVVIKGQLLELGQYELIVSVKGSQVIIYKHAIKFVRVLVKKTGSEASGMAQDEK